MRKKERKKENYREYGERNTVNRNADYGAYTVLFGTDSSYRWETWNILFIR